MRSRAQTIAIILSRFKKRFGHDRGARFQSTSDMVYKSGAARDGDSKYKSGTTGWLIPQPDGSVREHAINPMGVFMSHGDLVSNATIEEQARIDVKPGDNVGWTPANYAKALKGGWVRFSTGDKLFMANFNAMSSDLVIDHIKKNWSGQPIVLEMEFGSTGGQSVSQQFDDDKKALRWIAEQKGHALNRDRIADAMDPSVGGPVTRQALASKELGDAPNNAGSVTRKLQEARDKRLQAFTDMLPTPTPDKKAVLRKKVKRIKKSMVMAF